ncbi:MAG: tyrosine-type recombinase/integrase [Yersinia sp. (in: enterobacteria)]
MDDSFAHGLNNYTLNTLILSKATTEYLDQHTGRDGNVYHRLSWWSESLGDRPIGKISRQHIKAALETLKAEGKAPATLNRYKAALSSVFTYICDEHDLKLNPCREVKQQSENNARTRFLSDTELPRLLDSAGVSAWPRLYMLILMAITTGARRGELINLRWCDINVKARTAHIERTKNSDPRIITLIDAVISELLRFREVGSGYVFPHPSKLNTPFEYFDHLWQAVKNLSGISDFHFHDLRHTCASLLAMNGASLLEIAQVLGHKSITMTQRYSHLCNGHKARLTDRVFGGIAK